MGKRQIVTDLESWFSNPPFAEFVGVLVFQRLKPVKSGNNRVGMAAFPYQRDQFLREGMTLPGTVVPNKAWIDAPCVGFASTLPEALALMFPEG